MRQDSAPPTKHRQLFPRWSNTLTPWIIVSVICGFCGIAVVSVYGYFSDWWQHDTYAPDQPVLFSHHHHVSELRIDCRFCHGSVENSSFAGMPATETCMTCHSGVFTNSPMLAPVIKSARTGKPLQWTRVYDLPDYVYFNHSAHVNHGIGCTSCHGDIGSQRLTRKAEPIFMGWCLDCHRHPQKFLRKPEDIFSPSAPARPDLPPAQSAELYQRYDIAGNNLTDCYKCHR